MIVELSICLAPNFPQCFYRHSSIILFFRIIIFHIIYDFERLKRKKGEFFSSKFSNKVISTAMLLKLLPWVALVASLDPPVPVPKEVKDSKTNARLPPCGGCTNLVTSFEAGMERTKRGKLGGGDTAWEEKSGQKYATSEVRLAEITEQLCKDVTRGETQCHQHHGEWEELIEEWWAMDMETRPTMRQWLCVDKLKVCCEPDHFGADCKPCEVMGSNGKLCSGNGKCKGTLSHFNTVVQIITMCLKVEVLGKGMENVVVVKNMMEKNVISALVASTRASRMPVSCSALPVIKPVLATVLVLGPRPVPSVKKVMR